MANRRGPFPSKLAARVATQMCVAHVMNRMAMLVSHTGA